MSEAIGDFVKRELIISDGPTALDLGYAMLHHFIASGAVGLHDSTRYFTTDDGMYGVTLLNFSIRDTSLASTTIKMKGRGGKAVRYPLSRHVPHWDQGSVAIVYDPNTGQGTLHWTSESKRAAKNSLQASVW